MTTSTANQLAELLTLAAKAGFEVMTQPNGFVFMRDGTASHTVESGDLQDYLDNLLESGELTPRVLFAKKLIQMDGQSLEVVEGVGTGLAYTPISIVPNGFAMIHLTSSTYIWKNPKSDMYAIGEQVAREWLIRCRSLANWHLNGPDLKKDMGKDWLTLAEWVTERLHQAEEKVNGQDIEEQLRFEATALYHVVS